MQAEEIVADRYKVVRRLGAGAMGSIYEARDQVLHRDVAIKLLHPDPAPELVLRFQQEARAAASLEHRNIVRILDFGQLGNGQLYITMEMVQGRSLDTIIEDEGGLDPGRARSLLIDIAEGLAHCHRHDILHRDVKPANVMIIGETGHEQARIVDFGIAKFVKSESVRPESREELSQTKTGGALGSPAFMSPEAARGQELDQRSDVYSFGCLAFQMLSGALPFQGESATATLMMQIEAPAPDLQSACSGAMPEDLVSMVSRCLEKKPDFRFPSFGEIIGTLSTVNPEAQVPDEMQERLEEGKSASGRNWIVAGACLLLLVACLAACAVLFLAVEPPGETGESTSSGADASVYDRFPKLEDERPILVPVKGSGRFQVQGHVSGRPVEVLRGRRDIGYLQFRHDDLTGDALSTIVELPLFTLKLLECGVDSKTFSYVRQLKGLKTLTLSSCDGISPDCLGEVAELPGLESIDLNHTAVDDPGLAMLCKIETLEDVSLRRCTQLSDASLSMLVRLPRLKRLRIGASGIEDGDTSGLLALRHLDELEVTKTPLSILRRLSLTTLANEKWKLSDTEILKAIACAHGRYFIGCRAGKASRFAVLDIDAGSRYHNPGSLSKILEVLSRAGLGRSSLYRSSYSGGWHLYIYFSEPINSADLRRQLVKLLTLNDFQVGKGQLEIFPHPGQGDSQGLGLRLPLQQGFAWLDKKTLEVDYERHELPATRALEGASII